MSAKWRVKISSQATFTLIHRLTDHRALRMKRRLAWGERREERETERREWRGVGRRRKRKYHRQYSAVIMAYGSQHQDHIPAQGENAVAGRML